MKFRTISIHGVPRSGTSWLGQVFNSHPNVAYKHQPLFSYRFKDRIKPDSTRGDLDRFLAELYDCTTDDFINDNWNDERSDINDGIEKAELNFMVMKMVRYHHLLPLFLEQVPDLKVIGLVRNPCAVINSWLRAPREFEPGWDPAEEWLDAPKKNRGHPEEFNGFNKWCEVAELFLGLESRYPARFITARYEELVSNPVATMDRLFEFCDIGSSPQVHSFIESTRSTHDQGHYSLRRSPEVANKWKTQLDPVIRTEIVSRLRDTEIGRRFL